MSIQMGTQNLGRMMTEQGITASAVKTVKFNVSVMNKHTNKRTKIWIKHTSDYQRALTEFNKWARMDRLVDGNRKAGPQLVKIHEDGREEVVQEVS